MKRTLLLLAVLATGLQVQAIDIVARKVNEQFEETMRIDKLEQITVTKQPTTQYTPKNLRTQYIVGFQGRNTTTTGAMTYWSNTFTDYDTYITKSYMEDGKFYIEDNLGKVYQTGVLQDIDTSELETAIQNNTNNINNNTNSINQLSTRVDNNTTAIQNNRQLIQQNTQRIDANTNALNKVTTQVKTNTNLITKNSQAIQVNSNNIKQVSSAVQTNVNNIKALGNNLQRLDHKVDRVIDGLYQLDDKVDKGLATVTALTSLHPNPRHQGKTQIAIGSGVYNNNIAGAVGIFHHVNDKVMISIGASYGGSNSWAGNIGLSIGF